MLCDVVDEVLGKDVEPGVSIRADGEMKVIEAREWW